MKNSNIKIGIVSVLLILTVSLYCQTIAEPPINYYDENAGSEDNPFQIGTLANLRWLSETPEVWGSYRYSISGQYPYHDPSFHFIQTADIDASESIDWVTIAYSPSGNEFILSGFIPIGRNFHINNFWGFGFYGDYDGNNYVISNLYMINTPYITPITQTAEYYGLFARTGLNTIKNVGLENAYFGAKQDSGLLIGRALGTVVFNCHVQGIIEIIGYNENFSEIFWGVENTFPTKLGGLVGRANGALIENCSARVSIDDDPIWGWSNIGGLIGDASGYIYYPPYHPWDDPPDPIIGTTRVLNSAFYGNIVGNPPAEHPILQETYPFYKAGLIGVVNEFTIIENCIVGAEGIFQNTTGLGGFIGTESMMSNSFWDIESSGVSEMYSEIDETAVIINNHGLSSIEMKLAQTYIDAGFDFETIWDINPEVNNGYPFINLRSPNVGISDEVIKSGYKLTAYPNPFNPETTISFVLKTDSVVTLDIYNIKGQKVKSLVNEYKVAGEHNVVWNGTDQKGNAVGSGIYFYRMNTAEYSSTRKMMLLK